MNLDEICAGVQPKPKMHRTKAGGRVAHAGCHVVKLRAHGFADELNSGANPVAIALGAAQSDVEPVA